MNYRAYLLAKKAFTFFKYGFSVVFVLLTLYLAFVGAPFFMGNNKKRDNKKSFSSDPFKGFSQKTNPKALIFSLINKNIAFFCSSKDQWALVGIKGKGNYRSCGLGEVIYLKIEEELLFSKANLGLWIELFHIDDSRVKGYIGFSLAGTEEKIFFEKEIDKELLDEFIPEHKGIKALKEAVVYRKDCLTEYLNSQKINAYRLYLPSQKTIVLLSPNDPIYFVDSAWTSTKNEGSEYIASLEMENDDSITLSIRSLNAEYEKQLSFELSKKETKQLQSNFSMTHVKQRGPQLISCKLGKQNSLLKKGDWLIKTSSYSKILKTSEEKEKCLSRELEGDLFIFEKIEQKDKSIVLHGKCFDKNREKVESFYLAFPMSEKSRSSKRAVHNRVCDQGQTLKGPLEYNEKNDELLKFTGSARYNDISK